MDSPNNLTALFDQLAAYAKNEPEYLTELIEASQKQETETVMRLIAVAVPEPGFPEAYEMAAAEAERRAAKHSAMVIQQAVQGVLWPE